MKILKFFRPNKLTLVLFILVGLLSSIKPYGFNPTTKITWDEYRGTPYTFIKLTGCNGPCYPDKIGGRYFIQDFDLRMFIMDALIWYLIACFIAFGLSIIIRNEKVKAIVTNKL